MPSEETGSEESIARRDLRQELLEDLSARFASALKANGSLPDTAQKALTDLLDSEALTSEEIIEAASVNDPSQEDGADE